MGFCLPSAWKGWKCGSGGEKIRVLEHPWVAISETPLSVRHQYEMLLHGE